MRCPHCSPAAFSIAPRDGGGWWVRNERGRVVRVFATYRDAETWVLGGAR